MSQNVELDCRQLRSQHDNLFCTLLDEMKHCQADETTCRNCQTAIIAYVNTCHKLFNQTCTGTPLAQQMCAIHSTNIFQNLDLLFESVMHNCSKIEIIAINKSILFLQILVEILNLLAGFCEQLIQNFLLLETINICDGDAFLPQSLLHIIFLAYEHCRSSEACYGDSFCSVSEILGELFRKTFSLQKVFTTILVKMSSPVRDESMVKCCNKVCHLLLDISKIVVDMDSTLIGATWKLLLCFLGKSKTLLMENIILRPFQEEIIKNGETFSDQCNATVDDLRTGDAEFLKSITLSIRMTAFFLGVSANLVSEYYPSIDEETAEILLNFLFKVMKNLQSCYVIIPGSTVSSLSPVVGRAISGSLVKEMDKCISLLAPTKTFQDKLITCVSSTHDDAIVEVILNIRLVKLMNKGLIDCEFIEIDFSKMYAHFFQLQNDVYPYLVQSARCYFDENQSEIPLLSKMVSNSLCNFLFFVPNAKFHLVENEIFSNITSSNPYNYLLAVDLCCCIMRSLSDAAILEHVKVFIEPLKNWNLLYMSSLHYQVGALLSRFFKLLSSDQQMSLLSSYQFSSGENHPVWFFLGGNMLDSARDKPAVLDHIISVLSKILRSWLQKRSLADLPVMISLFRVVTNILKYISNNDVKVSMKSKTISDCSVLLTRLWKTLPLTSSEARSLLFVLYTDLVRVTSCFVEACLDHSVLTEILRTINNLWLHLPSNCAKSSLAYSCVEILLAFRHSVLSQDLQNEVTSLWKAVLSNSLLPSSGWLIRYKSVDGFENFSQVTKHPDIVRCICSKETDLQVRELVKSHFKRDVQPLSPDINLSKILVVKQLGAEVQINSEVLQTVKIIVENVEKLKSFAPETLNEGHKKKLQCSVNVLQSILNNL